MMRFASVVVAFLGVCASTAEAQVLNPTPIRSTDVPKGTHKLGFDIGWGSVGGLDFDFGGGVEVDLDYDAFPIINTSYLYGVESRFGVGAQFTWLDVDFDDSTVDDESGWTFGGVAAYTFAEESTWGVAGFLELGLTDESGLHYQIGVLADFRVAEELKMASYLQYGFSDLSDSDDDLEITGFRLGVTALWQIRPELVGVFDLAWELQDWEFDPEFLSSESESGDGFAFSVGVQYWLK